MGNIGTYTFEADVDYSEAGLANLIGGATTGTTATAWVSASGSSVPEPTSAMLLLLGFAGLALKRKNA